MEFRVTVGLGQDSADTTVLESRADALQESLAGLPEGAGVVVVVDLSKPPRSSSSWCTPRTRWAPRSRRCRLRVADCSRRDWARRGPS